MRWYVWLIDFAGGSMVKKKNSPASARDMGSIPRSARPSGERKGNPLQYSCLENTMDREAYGLESMGSERAGHDLATT